MKVFHIESGLGNQMLDYADFLASKSQNPNEDFYIETIIYEIGDSQKSISMWNGYELENVFGIHEKNIKELFTNEQWKKILNDVSASRFWDDGWTYSDAISDALAVQGLKLNNVHRREHTGQKVKDVHFPIHRYVGKVLFYRAFPQKAAVSMAMPDTLYRKSSSDDYDGHYLRFMYKGNHIERIHPTLITAFKFPEYDQKNDAFARKLRACNSVAIHARRGDFLGQNSYCYKYGYFKRAVNYIKRNIDQPIFVFFCDSGSVKWCKQNAAIFGLDYSQDKVVFVDWNVGIDSFRDMQLMADCKHNIITNSSFGWWGAYLNQNPDKITCAPDARINTTHWF